MTLCVVDDTEIAKINYDNFRSFRDICSICVAGGGREHQRYVTREGVERPLVTMRYERG